METPSLWKKFIWPSYNPHEEQTIVSFLKSCGRYIETLSFPDDVPSTAPDIFSQFCSHVTTLCLPTCGLQPAMLKVAVRHMRGLQNLDVGWCTDMRELLSLNDTLTDVTIRVQYSDRHNVELDTFLNNWIKKGFVPENLNIICNHTFGDSLLSAWTRWNSNFPAGRTGCVKVYDGLKIPMNLFPALPVFQLQFGETATLPLLDISNLFEGIDSYHLIMTECSDGSKAVYKTDLWTPGDFVCRDRINCNIDDLRFVTDIDFSGDEVFQSDQLEQVALMCPNLQRLGLSAISLNSLRGLHTVAECCHNLQGLNLLGIQVTQVEDQLQLWEILSNLKLTHLAMELCLMGPLQGDNGDVYKQTLISLFQKCVHLLALHLEPSAGIGMEYCPDCGNHNDQDVLLLGHFPSLTYCRLNWMEVGSSIVENITSSCLKLRYVYYNSQNSSAPLSLEQTDIQCHLYQLYIESDSTDIPDTFLNAVSAHRELEHVVLSVRSVPTDGIAVLISNSPQLSTLHVIAQYIFPVRLLADTKLIFSERFSRRKLFTVGSFQLQTVGSFQLQTVLLSLGTLQPNIDVTSSLWKQTVM